MARRNQHSLEEIKNMILIAAETIIIHEGYSALTVRRIAMNIGYTVASIYMAFANMNELKQHINAKTLDDLVRHLVCVSNHSPKQQLIQLACLYVRFAQQNFNRWLLLFSHENKLSTNYQEIIELFAKKFAALVPKCSANQNEQAARSLWYGVHGICVLSLSKEMQESSLNDAENAVKLLVENFIEGWTDADH